MGPIDYTGQVANPFASALQGYQIGNTFQQMEAQKAQQQQAMLIAQQEAEQKRALNERLNALGSNPNASLRDYISVANLLPEKQAESIRKNWEMLDAKDKHTELTFTTQVLSAMNSGQTGVGVQMLKDRAESEKDPNKAKVLQDYARLAELSPAQATKTMAVMVAALPGGDKILEGLSKAGTEERAANEEGRKKELFPAQLTEAQSKAEKARVEAKYAEDLQKAGITEKQWAVRNLQSQIGDRSARLGLDRERLRLETAEKLAKIQDLMTAIPPGLQPELNKAAVAAGAAKQAVTTLDDLAARFAKADLAGGAAGSAAESLKKWTGNQDSVTQLRQEYTRIRNSQALKFLPPGPATDKDVAMALEGFPPATADAKQMASFLRGMAKLSAVEASVEGAKVDWMANNKGMLTRSGNSFLAGEYAVKPGETFQDLSTRIAADVAARRSPKPAEPGKPAPKPTQPPVMDAADAILAGKK